MTTTTSTARTLALTSIAMLAFAANSLLCRMALGPPRIDAASFTAIRLAAGALTLWLLLRRRGSRGARTAGDWTAAGMLFVYAIAFSLAYRSLSAGTGALILFGFVQLTMLASGLRAGERLTATAWLGLLLAVGGLVYLLLPGLAAPDPEGAVLMAAAGIAWGVYSLRGRGIPDPLHATAGNFVRSVPLALLALLPFVGAPLPDADGVLLAVASGAFASGIGYTLWYSALRGLNASRAATVQLSVPVIAAFGGVLLLDEPLGLRLMVATVAVLGGIALVLGQRKKARSPHTGR
jgi:drug/metabolite transporter (DMT)-like permease